MVKNRFSFWAGVYCGMLFIAEISLHRGPLTLGLAAFLTVLNLAIGLEV